MEKEVTVGKMLSALLVIAIAAITFAMNVNAKNAVQDEQIITLKTNQVQMLLEQKKTNELLIKINSTLKTKKIID